MRNAHLKNWISSGLVAAAALFGAASPAQAVVYVGNFDPAFGAIFPNLGFRGTATFNLPAACDGLTGMFSNAAPGCGGGLMQITSASVDLYDIAAPTFVLQTMNFATPGTILSVTLSTPLLAPTLLTGVTSGFSNSVLGTISQAQIASNNYNFYLGFSGNTATLGYSAIGASLERCTGGPRQPNNSLCGFSETSPEVKFTAAIPEPETYALMLAGLAGMAFVARRQRAR